MLLTAAEELHMTARASPSVHKSSGKQSHPIILLRVMSLPLKTQHIHLCHTPVGAPHASPLIVLSSCFTSFSLFYFSHQATRILLARSCAASEEALALPRAPAVITLWIVEGKGSPPFQPTCQRAWLRCKHPVSPVPCILYHYILTFTIRKQ